MDENDGLQFQDLSGGESAEEEEDRSDEIKQLLTKAFSEETFDDLDSETSYAGDHSTREAPRHPHEKLNGLEKSLKINGEPPKTNGHTNGINSYFGDINNLKGLHRNGSLSSFFNGMGAGSDEQSVLNGNLTAKRVRFQSHSEQALNIFHNGRQADRGDDEVEFTNETVSMLHQKHCPQNVGNGDAGYGGAAEKVEQLEALLELREKRIQKLEQEAEVYAKDKRSLNHQIGLMKTEMIQMKNSGDELQRVIELRDEEIRYLKTKMTEAIEEYEQVRQQEMNAREETNRYADEVAKLQQQVQLLSSIGTSTQQAEINDVVRQIRERHAKEIAVWQTTAADLESQLQIYKRGHQNALHESIVVHKENVAVQTEPAQRQVQKCTTEESSAQTEKIPARSVTCQVDPPKPAEIPKGNAATQTDKVAEEKRVSALFLQQARKVDFGQSVNLVGALNTDRTDDLPSSNKECGAGDAPATQISRIETELKAIEKWKEALAKIEEEKTKLIEFYEREVEEYKTKLALMPSQLYDVWTKQQEDLGLLFGSHSPVGRRRSSVPARRVPITRDSSTQAGSSLPTKVSKDAQTDVAGAHGASEEVIAQLRHRDSHSTRSPTTTFSEKETSSVVIQTEETLETFNMLGDLIQGWAKEVKQSQLRAERAEKQAYTIGDKYVKIEKSFKALKKESKERDIYWRQKCEEQRLKFLSVLSTVSSKLDIVDIGSN